MNTKTKEYREKIAEIFIKSLEEKELNWKKNWTASGSHIPYNVISQKNYKGANRLYLSFLSIKNNWDDPRFATFKQIQDKGWKLQKGSKGNQVEYWMPYDFEKKKVLTWQEFKKLQSEGNDKKIGLVAKYYTVFNAKDIIGIPTLEVVKINHIEVDALIKKISKNMDVEILNDGNDRAFYRPSEDKIHLPEPKYFKNDYSYNSVALHELSHATGAAHRLNRNIKNMFGNENYAFEELVAEISSCFMSENLSIDQDEEHLDNHKAYIQSWISDIKEKPETLFLAIKEANKAADYLELKAELISEKDFEEKKAESIEVKVIEITKEQSNSIFSDIKKAGFIPSKTLISNFETLNLLTGKKNTMKDVHAHFKKATTLLKPDELKIVDNIIKECKNQEKMKKQTIIEER